VRRLEEQRRRGLRTWPVRFLLVAAAALAGSAYGPAMAGASTGRVVVLLGDGVAGALLRGAVATAKFGQAESDAITGLDSVMGSPKRAAPVGETGQCTVDALMQWPALTAYFDHGRFVGFSTLSPTGTTVPAANVVTWEGLRVGDTLSEAHRLYGRELSTSSAQGGTWFAKTSVGTLDGYLSAEVGQKSAPPRILSIEAGAVGCPAMSP
jgi:hypothetical protein